MLLKEWQKKNRWNNRKLAEELDIDESYLSCVVNFHRVPSRKLAIKIEKFTSGEVTATELLFGN